MKRLSYISLAVTLLFAVSCKKVLQPEYPSAFTQDYIFSNLTDANKAVNSIYALFNTDAYTSRISTNQAGNTDVEAGGASAAADGSRRDIWTFEATSANTETLAPWNNAYNAINRANDCIEGLQASTMASEKSFRQLLGEAKTLRAYWYYLLVNNWGDVPFSTKSTKAGDDFYLPKTGRDSILTYLINDLISIEPDMSWADQLDFGTERINREFVEGFIARLALMRGGYWLYPNMTMQRKSDYLDYYKIANKYCKMLVSLKPHQLSPFATVFDNINKSGKLPNDDVLYEVAFAPGSGDVGWNIGITVAAGTHNYGATTIAMLLTPTYYYSFDTTDLRLPTTCSLIAYDKDLNQVPVGITSITMGKWNRLLRTGNLGSSTTKGTGINWPVMRYSDVLLMLAESENEIAGPDGIAQDALRKVRQRAFPTALWPTKVEGYINPLTGKDAFFNAIVNERAWEFGGEFLRKYDLARWNLYGNKVAATINTLNQMGADAKSGSGTYSNLPDILYYYKVGPNIVFLNKYTKLTNPAAALPPGVTTYFSTNWNISLYSTTNNGPSDYALRQYRGYTDPTGATPVRYLVPIYSSVISSSLGVLDNNGYGFK